MVFCPITDHNNPTNATAGRLLFREENCSPDNEFDSKFDSRECSKCYTPIGSTVFCMYLKSSNHLYDHIRCYVIETSRVLEFSLTCCSAARQESFLLFTAYELVSQYASAGKCAFTEGFDVSVSPSYSVSQPATVNSTKFESIAIDSFVYHLGFTSCVEDEPNSFLSPANVIATPTASIPSLLNAVTSTLNQNSTLSNPTGTDSPNKTPTQPVST